MVLTSKHFNVISEPSVFGIHQVLREIWPFEHEFQSTNFGKFNFWGYQICQQTVHKIAKFHSHFQLKSKRELKLKLHAANFSKKLIQKSQTVSKEQSKPIIVSFDGFYDQTFVPQAMPPLRSS